MAWILLMALSIFTDIFSSGTAAPGSTIVRTGYGFQPVAAIFIALGNTSAVDAHSNAAFVRSGVGVAVSPTSRWASMSLSDDAAAAANSWHHIRTDSCIGVLLGVGTPDGLLDLQSFDADGLTLVVDNQFTTSWRIMCIAIGGADATNAAAGTITEPAAIGDQDTTALAFQPDFLFFSGGVSTALNTATDDSNMCIGAAAGSTPANAVWAGASNNGAGTMQTMSYCKSGECIALFNPACDGIDARASLTTWLSNGWRLNWSERAGSRLIGYLALKGGSYAIGDFLSQTAPGSFAETGLAFAPKGAIFMSAGKAESVADTPTDHYRLSAGVAHSAAARQTQGVYDLDAAANSSTAVAIEHDNIYVNIDDTAVLGLVDASAWNSDGWTLNQVDPDPAQAFVWYVAFGNAPGGGLSIPIAMDHYRRRRAA